MPEKKKVDKDAICPINVISLLLRKNGRQRCFRVYGIDWTNLGHISVDLIFLRPQCCKSQFLEDSTENCILEPREPRSEDLQGVLLGVAFHFITIKSNSCKQFNCQTSFHSCNVAKSKCRVLN